MNGLILAVAIDNLTVKFGSFTAVDDVSFSVRRGEIFGFLGANGAGKTTTIRVMCGLLVPSAGTVSIAGRSLEHGGIAVKERVGYMSQKFTLYDDMTIEENIAFKASLRRIPPGRAAERMRELLAFIGFSRPADTMVRDLPSGVKQQVSLAATLLHEPEIVFLDEPTAGVAPAVRARFWALIRELAEKGTTVIVTTHYMDEAEQCERIALMRAGRLIALDSPAGLKRTAYPEPLVEISAAEGIPAEVLSSISSDPAVARLWSNGLKYRAVLRPDEVPDEFLRRLPPGISGRAAAPSLEDVFIRLVEGADR